jgi:hypothetical protein
MQYLPAAPAAFLAVVGVVLGAVAVALVVEQIANFADGGDSPRAPYRLTAAATGVALIGGLFFLGGRVFGIV